MSMGYYKSAVQNVGIRSISISVYSTIFSSIGCSFKLFKEIKIVLPHMDIMKMVWQGVSGMCSWNAELQDWIA